MSRFILSPKRYATLLVPFPGYGDIPTLSLRRVNRQGTCAVSATSRSLARPRGSVPWFPLWCFGRYMGRQPVRGRQAATVSRMATCVSIAASRRIKMHLQLYQSS